MRLGLEAARWRHSTRLRKGKHVTLDICGAQIHVMGRHRM